MPPAAGVFGPPTQLAPPQGAQADAEGQAGTLSCGPGGVALGVLSLPFRAAGSFVIQTSALTPALTFATPQTQADYTDPAPTMFIDGPAIATPAQGPQIVAWTTGEDTGTNGEPASGALFVAVRAQGGGYTSPQRLTQPDTASQTPLAAATVNASVLVWSERSGLYASVSSAGKPISPPARLGENSLVGSNPEVAVGAAGHTAVAVWVSQGTRLMSSVFKG
jgi:hypothetical protein